MPHFPRVPDCINTDSDYSVKSKEVIVYLRGEQKLQEMDERRIRRLAEGYCQFSDIEKKVLPIISKCLDGISAAGAKIDEKQVNV